MTVFSVYKLAKNFDDKQLFNDVSFGMQSGERIGIIGKNGAGKTTLMKIIAGLVEPDSGEVVLNNKVRVEYLEQMPEFERHDTVIDVVMKGKGEIYFKLEEFKELCDLPKNLLDEAKNKRLEVLTKEIDEANAWHLENEAKTMLSKLSLTRFNDDVMTLSGGLKKRVSLARALLSKPELLILDEPTNHLDADAVQWLQDYLQNSNQTILFVTHDRYFLDAVTTKILEIDQEKIFSYPGNYQLYLERKHELMQIQTSTVDRKLSRLRVELAWLQRGAPARRSKQASRVDWIDVLKKSAVHIKEKKIKIELGTSFLGSRIIEAHSIEKTIGHLLFSDFTYVAKPKDRIGIIGPNGGGKSTLLKVLAGYFPPDKGTVKHGTNINIGFFHQEIEDLDNTMTVIGAVKQIAEYINVGVGKERFLTPRDLLDKFLFPRNQHSAQIGTLSGGEKRRLALIRMLMSNPNVLLLDEPTNDFDIQTLAAFEEYLDDFYGVLLIVSHDRAFLDRTVEFIYAFDGKGNIKQYPGNYTAYLKRKEEEKRNKNKVKKTQSNYKKERPSTKKKLSYKEQLEYDKIEKELPILEDKKVELENKLATGQVSDYREIEVISKELEELSDNVDEMTMRWLELEESLG